MKRDITDLEDIKSLVDQFYSKVRADDLLAEIFNSKIENRWPVHLEKMYRFWQTVLLDEHTYYGSPFLPHARLPVSGAHFEKWLKLFCETVDENFSGVKADKAKFQGHQMAKMFHSKIEYFKSNPATEML